MSFLLQIEKAELPLGKVSGRFLYLGKGLPAGEKSHKINIEKYGKQRKCAIKHRMVQGV